MRKKKKKILWMQIGALLILALSVLAMYFTDLCYEKSFYRLLLYVNGGIFWLSLVGLVFFSILLDVLRRKSRKYKKMKNEARRIGIINFWTNKYAKAADISLGISLAGTIGLGIFAQAAHLLMFVFLSALIFSFGLHCILNGENYRYVTYE